MTEIPAPHGPHTPPGDPGPHPAPADASQGRTAPCLFCDRTQHTVLSETASWYIRLDNYPANPGHVEAVTKRHVVSFFDLDGDEASELWGVLDDARDLVEVKFGRPDGWTIGVNDGRAAGRSIDHLHVHLIPRHHGDVADPRGGVRQCAPNCTPDLWAGDLTAHRTGIALDQPKETR